MAVDSDRGRDRAGPHQGRAQAAERECRQHRAEERRLTRVHSRAGARSARRQPRHAHLSRTCGDDNAMTTILIVEDNEMNRDMLSRRLQRKGYEILIAIDGAKGIDVATANAPDLILMDMSLPVMDGWEATRRLKADKALQHIPIIALTAHAMANDREKALEAGCDDYDTKPIELPRLLAKMEALLFPSAVEKVS